MVRGLLHERVELLPVAVVMIALRRKQTWQCGFDRTLIGDCRNGHSEETGIVMLPGVHAAELA